MKLGAASRGQVEGHREAVQAALTPYHAKYLAHALTRRCSSDQLEKLNQSILSAAVDLNPHQIEAALFAFRSPLSRGAILADEVGLGKTIEAGLILSQLWAERKRRILCITPASLRPQWSQELLSKFFIDSEVLESKNYNRYVDQGVRNPFEMRDKVVICSYYFARSKQADLRAVPWDLVVVDEAHRLRNVYKTGNKVARAIRDAIGSRPKILLTATPLQNSLMELYGLVSFIDPHIFGDTHSFRDQFSRQANDMEAQEFERLRQRIRPICQRTLRRQVTEYVRYTNRVSLTQDFTPTDQEARLYEAVSAYLQRPDALAIPKSRRALMTLVVRKILASSSFAIAGTLEKLAGGLKSALEDAGLSEETWVEKLDAEIGGDFESVEELKDEWAGEEGGDDPAAPTADKLKDEALKKVRQEIEELTSYQTLAKSITQNAKGGALLTALKTGFAKATELGAPRKALIFTESRRTQLYLKEHLEANGYAGQVALLNGSNSDSGSKAIHAAWLKRHVGEDCVTGLTSVDMKTALIEEFRDRAAIMVATESGAEGINLQFCNLVVNFDLPWNPQRIEQRIGRCHRYGQEHDVVVINFVNRKNEADRRVYQLLQEKLRLFDGVFGASDEVLGAIEAGVDFEKRIHDIYQSCRTPGEINAAFDKLQEELDGKIQAMMQDARSKLMEHFDEDVHKRLRTSDSKTKEQVGRFEEWLWRLTRHELDGHAKFEEGFAFNLHRHPEGADPARIPLGGYRLVTQKAGADAHNYRLNHPLAETLVSRAKGRALPPKEIVFCYTGHPGKISLVANEVGKSGWLQLSLLTIEALEVEEHLLFSGIRDDGTPLDPDTCEKLFSVPGQAGSESAAPEPVREALESRRRGHQQEVVAQVTERNGHYFQDEMDKLESWGEDLKRGLERELAEMGREIKALKRDARQEAGLAAKVELMKKAKDLEAKRAEKRKRLFEEEDEIERKKEELIGQIEARLKQSVSSQEVFSIRWKVA